MGMLDQVLGGVLGARQQRGGMQAGGGVNKALLLLLAAGAAKMWIDNRNRTQGQSAGQTLPGGAPLGRPGQSNGDMDGGFGGGLGDILGGVLGGGRGGGGGLGGLLQGAGGMGGLGALIEQFNRNGRGRDIQSWVSTGANQQMSPQDLEEALGPDVVDDLAGQTGMERQQLLAELSETLPDAVDQLTPDGELPPPEALQVPQQILAGPRA